MKEIVIISGKGGTGKTSITAALANIASEQHKLVVADCDVDAADMHILLKPRILETHEFMSGKIAQVNPKKCISSGEATSCDECIKMCRFGAISHSYKTGCKINPVACEGCGVCVRFCKAGAIDFIDRRCGDLFVSDTRFGTMVHAHLDPGAENSGKLVTSVRTEAKKKAKNEGVDFILVDGSPGIGCPVIASITGADLVLIITEPTISGKHDLQRVLDLTKHFKVQAAVCVNKSNINADISKDIIAWCEQNEVPFIGELPYDKAVTRAQLRKKTVVEYTADRQNSTANGLRAIWENICQLNKQK